MSTLRRSLRLWLWARLVTPTRAAFVVVGAHVGAPARGGGSHAATQQGAAMAGGGPREGDGNDDDDDDSTLSDALALLPTLHPHRRQRRRRRSTATTPRPRKPRFYWQSTDNLRRELRAFWEEELGVPISRMNGPDEPPPIPSERVLIRFGRHDLRGAIAAAGGRDSLSHALGGARVVPGRWKDAVARMEECRMLLPRMDADDGEDDGDGSDGSESAGTDATTEGGTLMELVTSSITTDGSDRKRRKEKWSKELAVKQLYYYLESYRRHRQRPAVFMPQRAELNREGYDKLFVTLARFKSLPCSSIAADGVESVDSMGGLVPFQEWSQLHLFIELKRYLHLYHDNSEEYFPDPSEVLMSGSHSLYELIRIHGGKTFLAQKLDMKFAWDPTYDGKQSWGTFSLSFAIQLLQFIRSQYFILNPPLYSPAIAMPSERDLLSCGQDELASRVATYGGYENVARRLGLDYFDGTRHRRAMNERAFQEAQRLWKDRRDGGVIGASTGPKKVGGGRKRRGPWTEELVVKELHTHLKENNPNNDLPPNVMPRVTHLSKDGRGDLIRAIYRFGGVKHICEKAQLITIDEWQQSEKAVT